jgi:hypothetical protein
MVAGLAAAASVGGACSSDPEESKIDPCNGALASVCGGSCEATGDCPSGLFCESSACTAECTPTGGECIGGLICSQTGRCVEGLNGFDIGGPDGGGTGSLGGDACTNIDLPFDAVTPSVLILVDQSGSMNDPFGGNNQTRWSVLHDALMNQTNGVVWTLRASGRFGLSLYTSHGGDEGGECPELTNVSLRLNNFNRIENVYGSSGPEGDTPTAESIEAATTLLSDYSEPGPKYIVLVTDGLPDNCEDPDAHDAQSQAMSVAAAGAAHDAGIVLIPMGLSDDIATQGAGPGHLQDLANAGSGLAAGGAQNAKYYVASDDPAELASQFQSIIGNIRDCVFDLGGTVDPELAHLGNVVLDGTKLDFDAPDGWRLATPRQIEVVGDACDLIKSSATNISITFPCDADAVIVDIR